VLARLRSGANVLVLRSGATVDPAVSALAQAARSEVDAGGQLVELSADDPWWRSAALEHAALAVVVAHRGAPERRSAKEQLAALALAGVPALLTLIEPASAADVERAVEPEVGGDSTEPDSVEPAAADPESADAHPPSRERDPSASGPSGWQIVQ